MIAACFQRLSGAFSWAKGVGAALHDCCDRHGSKYASVPSDIFPIMMMAIYFVAAIMGASPGTEFRQAVIAFNGNRRISGR